MVRRRSTQDVSRVAIQYVDIHSLEPYERNPRDNQQAISSVANSIRAFGFLVPIVIDSNNVIVAGHTRFEAAKQLGLDEVPAIVAGTLTPDQVKQFRLIDNKVSEIAAWDFDLLASEISALQESGIDFTQFGWTREEIDCLSDVVADDCLSAGAAVQSLESYDRSRRSEHRAPSTTRYVFGELVFFVPSEVYRRWATDIRAEFDFEEGAIVAEIKRRLGLTIYEEEYRRDNG